MKRYTGAEARALREAATAGPWHMEHASGAPPGDEWGEVVSRLHPAGGAGAPVPGMRLTWTRRGVGVLAERNARLIAAAPDLAATVEAMDAEIAELRATLAAERGEPEGALPGWSPLGETWHRDGASVCRLAFRGERAGWGAHVVGVFGALGPFRSARDAMRAADAARGAK